MLKKSNKYGILNVKILIKTYDKIVGKKHFLTKQNQLMSKISEVQ